MHLVPLPAFSDNYIWMLHDGQAAAVVDPGDDAPVRQALAQAGLRLQAILVTHHHADHVGGVAALRADHGVPVYGPAAEAIPEPYQPLAEGDVVEVLGLRFEVLEVPGHTAGHIAYRQLTDAPDPLLFCGDTLFSGGCGRLFEGTPAQMHQSLQRLAALPGGTRVCCTHEYTLSNLRFATAVEPDNVALAAHVAHCRAEREADRPTLPSTMQLERQINPFLRCDQPTVVHAARAHGAANDDAVEVFASLRRWKDNFR
jgi:hydroxyacylglutathione hydrolase